MYKKLLLILGLTHATAGLASENKELWIAGGAIGAATLVYLAMRESNDAKMERFYKFQKAYQSTVERHMLSINTQADLIAFAKQPWKVKEELHLIYDQAEKSYYELHARYASWFKPWNWSDEMKIAHYQSACLYNKTCFLLDIFQWAPFLQKDINLLTDQELVKIARAVASANSTYPIIASVQMLEAAIYRCKWQYSTIGCAFLFIDTLQQIKEALYATEQYANDKKEYEKYLLEIRRVQAEESKAEAQKDQAWAQAAQARAQQDQANAIRESNNRR